jgi:Putative zinc-finger
MQHLDEGTIHSWLDGALSGDEAARVEAHVKECPKCAAAVAEARGFIAASSRILMALDNAPRGVIPVAAPKKRVDPIVWRVAATLLIVAGGTLVVFRSDGREAQVAATHAETAANSVKAVSMAPTGDEIARTTAEPAPPMRIQGNPSRGTAIDSSQSTSRSTEKSAAKGAAFGTLTATPQTMAAPAPRVTHPAEARAPALQPNIPARENQKVLAPAGGAVAGNISTSSGYAGAATPTPQTLDPLRLRGAVRLDAASEQVPLNRVGTRRTLGVEITLYEVAPGDTVTFTEPVGVQLESVVVTGLSTVKPSARQPTGEAAATPTKRADAAVASALDSQRPAASTGALATAPSARVPATQVEVANGVTTISWVDAATGNVLKLAGRMPEARLKQIRISIERERAAAAAKKKP